jgi:hypothetical protein
MAIIRLLAFGLCGDSPHRPNTKGTEPNTQQTRRKDKDTSQKKIPQHVKRTIQHIEQDTAAKSNERETAQTVVHREVPNAKI